MTSSILDAERVVKEAEAAALSARVALRALQMKEREALEAKQPCVEYARECHDYFCAAFGIHLRNESFTITGCTSPPEDYRRDTSTFRVYYKDLSFVITADNKGILCLFTGAYSDENEYPRCATRAPEGLLKDFQKFLQEELSILEGKMDNLRFLLA